MLKTNKVKDLIGVALVVLTGLLYMTGVTHATVGCECDPQEDATSIEAPVEAAADVEVNVDRAQSD
ncbi:MAG TPA: hypothetical protein VGA70_05050 [Longimicrobiales bacterium]